MTSLIIYGIAIQVSYCVHLRIADQNATNGSVAANDTLTTLSSASSASNNNASAGHPVVSNYTNASSGTGENKTARRVQPSGNDASAGDPMSSDYDEAESHSHPEPLKLPAPCYGMGTNLFRLRAAIRKAIVTCAGAEPILDETEQEGCSWTKNDKTMNCTTVFGCYLPPLTSIVDDAGLRSHFKDDRSSTIEDWAALARRMYDGHSAPPAPADCVAVHVRRGDICNQGNHRRGLIRLCPSNDEYKKAVSKLLEEIHGKTTSNESYVYVMTDDAKFPFDEWKQSFRVEFLDMQRSQYNSREFSHVRDSKGLLGTHEVANVLQDLQNARRCKAFVGSFSAGLSREAYLLMMADRGYRAPYVSLDKQYKSDLSLESKLNKIGSKSWPYYGNFFRKVGCKGMEGHIILRREHHTP